MCRKGIFLVCGLLISCLLFAQKTTSKPVVKKPQYVMHVVKFGETLTKISQKYGVAKTDILKANPSLTADNLNIEQILRIPVPANKKILNGSETNDNELLSKPKVLIEPKVTSAKYHVVEKGQTMYAISKLYGIKVEDIQKWNQLTDYNLQPGTQLIVVDPTFKPNPKAYQEIPTVSAEQKNKTVNYPQHQPAPKKETVPPAKSETVESIKVQDGEITQELEKPEVETFIENESQKQLAALFKSKSSTGSLQKVKGTGAPMTTTLGAMESVYFAMHKTLPIGSVIKIKNLVNNKIIYAKVIGKLPETDENKHVIVRYSLGVKKDLQLQNGKCYVQIEYPN